MAAWNQYLKRKEVAEGVTKVGGEKMKPRDYKCFETS